MMARSIEPRPLTRKKCVRKRNKSMDRSNRMDSKFLKISFVVAAVILAGAVLWKWFAPSFGMAASARFAPKACVDCHQKESQAYGSQKFVHAPVGEGK